MAVLTNMLYIGSPSNPAYKFDNSKIQLNSAKAIASVDVIGNELPIDTFTVTVRYDPASKLVYAPIGKNGYRDSNGKIYLLSRTPASRYLKDVAYGTPIFWFVSSAFFAKGYVSDITRVGKYAWKITASSGVGLLDSKMHSGGIYRGTTAGTIIASIIGSTFSFTVASNVASIPVYGHLPYDTARNNLHRLLFAIGASLVKLNASIDYSIQFLSTDAVTIPNSRIALGGRVQYRLPSDRVEVTEHGYFALDADEEVVLFDNTETSVANHTTVIFSDPMHDVTATGLTIEEVDVNYAVVSGSGVLTGKKYTHTEHLMTLGTGEQDVKRVKDNHLVSFANSFNIAQRLLSYFQSARTVTAKIILAGEKCGSFVTMDDAFGDPINAFLSKMNVLVTSVIGADCELIEGYQPYNGNSFTHRSFFTANATFQVPAGAARIVIIGGGAGGQAGYNGEAGKGGLDLAWSGDESGVGEDAYALMGYMNQGGAAGGAGGAAGSPGEQAKVAVIDVIFSSAETLTISIGQGGVGGVSAGAMGSAGTASTVSSPTLGTRSSDSGSIRTSYSDPQTGDSYAYAGVAGVAGSAGGGTDVEDGGAGWHGAAGMRGVGNGNALGGAGGAGFVGITTRNRLVRISGGGGGGAAYGADGGAGQQGSWEYKIPAGSPYGQYFTYVYCATGGNGANAKAPSAVTYGCGGNGGHGGGGGGNGGGGYVNNVNVGGVPYYVITDANNSRADIGGIPGTGGLGSAGGRGGDGCVIVYY